MENLNTGVPSRLSGSEIHGFRTMEDLDFNAILGEAKSRWLRPNEIHAILCNHKHFTVHVKPMNLPKSGTIVLFDRKMLRNFRKDGHNWKKKKDGKTVKEAHEHLKVGNEERIHVYYAHGEDTPTFVRRCYWLLDKSLEHIVLVHYRETQECSPATPVNSNTNSAASNPSPSWPLPEEPGSVVDLMYDGGSISNLERNETVLKSHEQRLYEINTLDWDELLVSDDLRKLNPRKPNSTQEGNTASVELSNQYQLNKYNICEDSLSTSKLSPESSDNNFTEQVAWSNSVNYNVPNNFSYQSVGHEATVSSETTISGLTTLGGAGPVQSLYIDSSQQAQDGFENLPTFLIAESPESVDGQTLESSLLNDQSLTYPSVNNHHPTPLGQIFNITDISPGWAPSSEETKILVVGFFNDGQLPHAESLLYLACGDSILPVEVVQAGVYRCSVSPQAPGLVNLYMTFDGHKPISQILKFEFRSPFQPTHTDWQVFQLQLRLAHLLFSSSKGLNIYSNKVSQTAYKEAKVFAKKASISDAWMILSKMIEDTEISFPHAKDKLFELTLQNRVHEWLLEKVASGCKVSECDEQGQGVIHLCAILGYTWAVNQFAWSGLSLDYRDKCGWTALHWAAYCGREKMVATLLSAGAKPNLVTDPTSQNPGGCTAADIASVNGYEGLAAYLAEKALVAQFNDMTLAGNVSGSLQTTTNDSVGPVNFTEEEIYLKDTLAAYRTAADAAARIQTAFRERSLKIRSEAVESSNPENEARMIVAAMKIQHAFRHHDTRKKMAAAVRIQHRFRTWKVRRDFLNMRRQAIKIQAIFRGYQMRRQYGKIVWSLGVLEKAILRWRLKRKGLRGIQAPPVDSPKHPNQDGDSVEEDFFVASRKQAEERVERSVVRVQAMFRSKRAQEQYSRMKLECDLAKLEYEELQHPDVEMR